MPTNDSDSLRWALLGSSSTLSMSALLPATGTMHDQAGPAQNRTLVLHLRVRTRMGTSLRLLYAPSDRASITAPLATRSPKIVRNHLVAVGKPLAQAQWRVPQKILAALATTVGERHSFRLGRRPYSQQGVLQVPLMKPDGDGKLGRGARALRAKRLSAPKSHAPAGSRNGTIGRVDQVCR